MKKKETVHSVVFDVYELKGDSIQAKEKYRKLIIRRLEEIFPGRKWEELSQLEKDVFVYIDIKEDILEFYVTEITKRKRILKKIDEKLKTVLCEKNVLLVEHNKKDYNRFRTDYYVSEDSDSQKRKAYKVFCKDLLSINNHVPIPGFDEWVQQNESAIKSNENRTPLRIYDYEMDYYNSPNSFNVVSQSDVDHVVLEILKQIIEKEWGIEINIPKIRECLSFIRNNDFDEFEKVPMEYDSSLETEKGISQEEQQKCIADHAQYLMYWDMLKNLDFVEKKETIGRE